MATEKVSTMSSNPLDPFVLAAESTKGAAVVEVIKQALEAPGVHVFGELLDVPSIIELEGGEHAGYCELLQLFAYGTYRQYFDKKSQLPQLTPAQKKKLQHLTIVTSAAKSKYLSYTTLLQELEIKNVRDLEDLIIEAIYNGVVHGNLDQKNHQLEVDYTIGRDVRMEDLGSVVSTLQEWCDSCEDVLACVEEQISRGNAAKQRSLQHQETIEQKIMNIKASLKLPPQCTDEVMASDSRESDAECGDKTAKSQRLKKQRKTPIYFHK